MQMQVKAVNKPSGCVGRTYFEKSVRQKVISFSETACSFQPNLAAFDKNPKTNRLFGKIIKSLISSQKKPEN
jgi:hypothetical protein